MRCVSTVFFFFIFKSKFTLTNNSITATTTTTTDLQETGGWMLTDRCFGLGKVTSKKVYLKIEVSPKKIVFNMLVDIVQIKV